MPSTPYTGLDVTVTAFLSYWLGEVPVHNHSELLVHHHVYG